MANLISLLRTLLAFLTVGLLFMPSRTMYFTCFALTVIVIVMDGLDGFVARHFKETSKSGAVVDILADRIVEQVYWLSYAVLGWVGLWVPLLVMTRGIVVDGLRGLALEQGYTAFGETTMMQSKLGWWLVSSPLSRWLYAFFKAAAFAFMIIGYTPNIQPEVNQLFLAMAHTSVYIAVAFCIVRGLPVLIEGRRFLKPTKAVATGSPGDPGSPSGRDDLMAMSRPSACVDAGPLGSGTGY